MKIGIISDIHANYEALSVVSNYLERFCDQIYCLGDIVGYGPDPEKCVSLIRTSGYKTIAGNHEYAAVGKIDFKYFNKLASESIKYAINQLSGVNINYLRDLPLSLQLHEASFIHASFYKPSSWLYLSDSTIVEQFDYLENQIGFVGHTHQPICYKKLNDDYLVDKISVIDEPIILSSDAKYIINVGSLGQPRDVQTKSTFGVYDFDSQEFRYERMDYNIDRTIKKIKYSALPRELVNRLVVGK